MSDPLSVNLEHGERWWYAHVAELPGCFTRAETRGEALAALPEAIRLHLAFLEGHGRHESPSQGFSVVEEVDGVLELGESGGAVALFASDLKPVEPSELRGFLDLMRWNREALVGVVEPLTEEGRRAEPIPGKRSVDRTLRHIADAEEWYVSRLGTRAQRTYEDRRKCLQRDRRGLEPLERLALVREGAIHMLEAVFPDRRAGTFRRAAYTGHPEELWTFRKVLRRFVEHEREHIDTIRKAMDALESS
jgi:predicted RNase H-like HicB family nuclease/uncharacterized damage-inducible protein DinB